jgi:hypothetical protein
MKTQTPKKLLGALASLLMMFLYVSCASVSDDLNFDSNGGQECQKMISEHSISEAKARSIARQVVRRTRSTDDEDVSYVMAKSSALKKDVVAYIVNYPDDGGFCIVANDDRINPVLAYSENGSFSEDNEECMNYFVNNIETYMIDHCTSDDTVVSESNEAAADSVYSVDPIIKTKLGQRAPYNQVVEQSHPGCPVGCVPLASVMIMSYCKSKLVYNNYLYQLSNINKFIVAGSDTVVSVDPYIQTIIPGGNYGPIQFLNSYSGAVNAICRLVADLGTAMETNYTVSGSSTRYENARQVMGNIGFDVSGWYSYSDTSIVSKLLDGYLIYQTGCKDGETIGHAWAIDGCKYNIINGKYTNIYLNCDWGWYGSGNGYYCGDVFTPLSGYAYRLQSYFTVKKETN